ncbi:MAG: PQQ-dependent sugar dehydrogenase, partial [Rhizobiales bacterium]|nr:PQQ-dependent sugar dehydrogenase [Rhizobacter sp.]
MKHQATFPLAAGAVAAAMLAGCGDVAKIPVAAGTGPTPALPPPNKTLLPTVNIAPAQGWAAGTMPVAAAGTVVNAFATGLDHPRWIHVLPNGDVLVAESNAPPRPDESKGIRAKIMAMVMKRAGAGVPSANRITLLRDANGDGVAETRTVFAENVNSPFGMALVGNTLYVAATDSVVRYAYTPGATRADGPAQQVTDLPAGPRNHHWTKNLIASRDGSALYATVGSNSNVAEHGMEVEEGRAAIWQIDTKTGAKRLFASGLRNPNGMAWEPNTGALWTVGNERDEIGSDLVPDYLTSVRDGGFYGWPYS